MSNRGHAACLLSLVVVAAMALPVVAARSGVVLAAAGISRAAIVVSEGAPAAVRFAAEELKEHLDAMTGGDFQIVADAPDDGPAILLGDGPETMQAGIDVTALARDGYAIRTLDLEHDHDSYYWLQIDGGLRVLDWDIHSSMEPPDETWDSGVEAAVEYYDDRWVMEIRLPRDRLQGETADAGGSWGANFCRSMRDPPRQEDRYSSWSPLLRGRFHQPDLFGHLVFVR